MGKNRTQWTLAAILTVGMVVGATWALYVHDLHQDLRLEMWRNLSFVSYGQARALIQQGVDVDDRNIDGQTLLMVAAELGLDETVQTLISLGADVNARDDHGRTALMLAKQSGRTKAARLLQKAGAGHAR